MIQKQPPKKGTVMTAGTVAFRRRDYKHYVVVPETGCWSFLITFGPPKRWDFFLKSTGKRMRRDRYFLEFGHPACSEQ